MHVSIMGRSGSGKSSSSGLHFARILAGIPSGGIILGSKPEDKAFWQRIFAHRPDDLILFGPMHKAKVNWLEEIAGDVRNATDFLLTLSETRNRTKASGGGDGGRFWEEQKELGLFNAITILKLAYGKVNVPDIRRYIVEAGSSGEQMASETWKGGFHNQTNQLAFAKAKDTIERMDYEQAISFWLMEWPGYSDRVRTSVQADINGVLHALNTGIVRDLVSTETTVSFNEIEKGKWLLIDSSTKEFGESGSILLAGSKFIAERMILAREVDENSIPLIIWSDEYQNIMNSYDATFLAEARSHRGAMLMLSQSLSSYYAGMDSERGKHFVDALLTNVGCKIFHSLGDKISSTYAAELLDKYLEPVLTTSEGEQVSVYDEIMGKSRFKVSVSTRYEWKVKPGEFMAGRTGGPKHKLICDSIVVSSEPFISTGEQFLRVPFSQR
jgi:hypothetical protein